MLTLTRFGARDLPAARQFYDALAEILGAQRIIERDNVIGYKGASGVTFLIGTPREGEASFGNGTQVVFDAPSQAAVDKAHATALAMGGKCEGAPGLRGPAEMNRYAAYFRDLDGNKIMVLNTGAG